ncbi:MAG: hypothetical protein JHD16_14390 [Solirubrobacteraceae bacterium]|nr:hypothetical protein [Solirubrobacteraceae bacterium]
MTNITPSFPTWRWLATFAAFPVAGLLGRAVGGPVDELGAALLGGAATGAVLGAAQWLAARRALGGPFAWVAATAVGMSLGLGAGAAAVDFGTELGDLATMGFITGLALGGTQGAALLWQRRVLLARVWGAGMPLLYALGWTVTTLAGVSVEDQFTVFGATGALVVTIISGGLLRRAGYPVPAGTTGLASGSAVQASSANTIR